MTAASDAPPPPQPAAGRVLVVLCTYNERGNLAPLVRAILPVDEGLDVLVVDDDSPDGTGAVADDLAAADARVSVLHRRGERGLGSATVAGLTAAVDRGYDAAVTMDADGSHRPAHLPALLALLETCDVAVGSRYVPGGGVEGWPVRRRVMSRAINVYTRAVLGLTQRDCSGAFRAYRCDLLRRAAPAATRSRGYAFFEEFLHRCAAAGARIGETPITFVDRTVGESKIDWREAVAAVWTLARLGWADRLPRR